MIDEKKRTKSMLGRSAGLTFSYEPYNLSI